MHMQIDNERFRNESCVKNFISYKLKSLIKWPLTKHFCVCNSEFSFVSNFFSDIALPISLMIENNNALFLSRLAAFCRRICSNNKFHETIESIHSIISLLDAIDVIEYSIFQRYLEIRNDGDLFRLVCAIQLDIADRFHKPILFICNTCPKVVADD